MLVFDFKEPSNARPLAFDRPERIISAHSLAEVLPALAEIEAATARGLYAAGFLSYEAAPAFDTALKVREPAAGAPPLLWFGLYREPVTPPATGLQTYEIDEWQPDTPRAQYEAAIAQIRRHIADGDIYQANYTLRLRSTFQGDAYAWFDDLRRAAAVHFGAYLDIGTHKLLSLSPELFFSWDGKRLTARPMKGTATRAEQDIEDRERAEALRQSAKNRAENLMIVDLLRNDVSRVARPGSVAVPQLFSLETYPTVHQMTSTVTAETREGTKLSDVLKAVFPCGSITGAPKIRATEVMSALENAPRGPYCGAIGYVAPGGACVFNVAIRTIVIDTVGKAECGVGGGIVWDSTAGDEYAEAMAKSRFMAQASHGFELIETLRLSEGRYDWRERHLARLIRSAAELGFVCDRAVVEQALDRHAAQNASETRRVRLTLARDGAINIASVALPGPAPEWFQPANIEPRLVALAKEPVPRGDPSQAHKTTRRGCYERAKEDHLQAFDVLMWNEESELTEFTIGNLLVQMDGVWCTPPVSAGALAGVLREELLARSLIVERAVRREDLPRISALSFINSVRGWLPVRLA